MHNLINSNFNKCSLESAIPYFLLGVNQKCMKDFQIKTQNYQTVMNSNRSIRNINNYELDFKAQNKVKKI